MQKVKEIITGIKEYMSREQRIFRYYDKNCKRANCTIPNHATKLTQSYIDHYNRHGSSVTMTWEDHAGNGGVYTESTKQHIAGDQDREHQKEVRNAELDARKEQYYKGKSDPDAWLKNPEAERARIDTEDDARRERKAAEAWERVKPIFFPEVDATETEPYQRLIL